MCMNNQKFYSLILAAAASLGASAASVQPMQPQAALPGDAATQAMRITPQERLAAKAQARPARNARQAEKMAGRRAPAGPENLKIVTEVPQPDALKVGIKGGGYYSYSFLSGMTFNSMSSNISRYEIVGDKFYLSHPNCTQDANGYIVGDVKGNTITIQFPQWADHYEGYNYLGEPYTMDTYSLLCEFIPDEEGGEEGFYYPAENQTLTFTINADGSIYNPNWEDYMIGACEWISTEYDNGEDVPIDNPYWYWNGNGDFIQSITEYTEQPVTMPEGIATEEWSMIDGISGRQVTVGIDGSDMYLQGIFTRTDFNPVIKGKIDGDKVTFETGQYVGPYFGNMTLVYFQGVRINYNEDNQRSSIDMLPALVFSYDKDKKDLKAEETALFSSLKDKVRYYDYYEAPHLFKPDASLTGHKLLDPELVAFYPVEDGYTGEMAFNFPNVDAAGNILDPDKLFYNVIVDGEVFDIYPDEYPEDVEEDKIMTNIPYTHYGYYIYYFGAKHYFYFDFEGYDTMAIQTLYIDGDFESKSAVVTVCDNTGVKGVESAAEKSVEYFDLQGRRVSGSASGILLRRAIKADGTAVTTKVIKR